MAILIQIVDHPSRSIALGQALFEEEKLLAELNNIDGYKVVRIDRIRMIKCLREKLHTDLATAKTIVDTLFNGC